jgi:long-chain fatty acid transport protein
VCLVAGKADASTELNGLFDARSMGMGGTGVAYLDSAGAIPTNPAALDQIKKLTLTLNGFLFISQPEAPYKVTHPNGMGGTADYYETFRSKTILAPLFFLGGAYRLLDRVVVGAAFYPVIGQGTQAVYQPSPELMPQLEYKNKAALGLLEVGVPVSVRVLDTLSLAAMWRVTYMTQNVSTVLSTRPVPNPVYANIDVTGVNFAGLEVGLFYHPAPSLRLGLTYRNKVTVEGNGTTTTKNPLAAGAPLVLPTIQPFSSPHAFRAGIAISALDDKFLFATDVKYLMYAEAWKVLETTTIRDGKPMVQRTPAYWKDAYNVHLGAEYKLSDGLRVRGGYILATSATPEAYAKAFMAPPGVSHCFTAGVGLKVREDLDVDLAGSYVVLKSKIDVATPDNAGIGIYASHTGELSASATYHM